MKIINIILHTCCKRLMKKYYMKKYKDEIFQFLSLFYEPETGQLHDMSLNRCVDTLNWSYMKVKTIFAMCVYCGLVEPVKMPDEILE